MLVGHGADGAEGDHWCSQDQEWRSTGCHTWSFEHPRKHERLDNHRLAFPYLSFASFDIGCSWLPDLQIQRQNSCESISSLNSLTSMSSMGSMKDQDAKKKKKKSWVRTYNLTYNMLGFSFLSLSAVLSFPLFLLINAIDWLSVLSTLNLNLFHPYSWEAPSTKRSASRKAPKRTQTSRKLPPLTPQLLVPQRCLTRWKKVEKTSHRPSKLQPWARPQCEYTYTWIKMVAQHWKSQFSCPVVRFFSILLIISRIMESTEEAEQEETAVSELRTELWLKERELTDIRLEALGSAHQLEQLRDAMNNMQVCFPVYIQQNIWLEVRSLSANSLDVVIAWQKLSCSLSPAHFSP